jgi:hypothetical protein
VAELASLPPSPFDARLRAHFLELSSRHAAVVEQAIDDAPRAAAWWAEDLRAFVAHEHEAAAQREATLPLDLVEGRGVEAARELSRRLVRQFGELVEWWPEITRAVADLRAGGVAPERW